MADYEYDLITLGAGSGGVRASRLAGGYGAKVAVCEEDRVGGTCVLRGCIPKKLLIFGAHYADHMEDAVNYGWTIGGAHHDWQTLIRNKNSELDRLNGIYLNILKDNNVYLKQGRAVVIDDHTVEVGGERLTTENILIAVGGWPNLPSIPGIEHAITSNEALELPILPKKVVIVGGGYIAVEFAGIFSGFGSSVTEIIRGEEVLRGFDNDIRKSLSEEMRKRDIKILAKTEVTEIKKSGQNLLVTLNSGSVMETDCIMYATGRAANTKGLGLEKAGVELKKDGSIVVDKCNRTSRSNIYAVGDVTDRIQLTPVAIQEGHALADMLFNKNKQFVDYSNVPSAVFSTPPIAVVGLTEEEAKEQFEYIDVYESNFKPLVHTISGRDERTFMKLVVDSKTDVVLGCHMMGIDAPEIIQGIAIAIKCGAKKGQFDATTGIHPSSAEEFVTMRSKRSN
ncbi:MAG: glutathione-disulfide reductase [Rhodospirillales bacterium]|nr:glutathione-disulfide reductase [Rhodospirillales bacterium]